MLNIVKGNSFMGKTLVADDGKTEITVSVEAGPRIIGLRPVNGFNVMYEDSEDKVSRDCSDVYGKGAVWHIYGGHRLWLSPENDSTYYPDNNPVSYEINDNEITFFPEPWKTVNVQPSMSVLFMKNGELKITHKIKNLGEKRDLCLWALTVMKSGGTLTVPLSEKDTGFLANRNVVFWHYASVKDERLEICDNKIILKSNVKIPEPFKIGTFVDDFKATYEIEENGKKQVFTKRLEPVASTNYPDFHCNAETYCTHLIHEIETLSPIYSVNGGETVEHVEYWRIEE